MDELVQTRIDTLRGQSWHIARSTRAAVAVFEERAKQYGRWLQLLTMSGFIIPVAIGTAALAFGTGQTWWESVLLVSSILGGAQFLLSFGAYMFKWKEKHDYAIESASDNARLSRTAHLLADDPPDDLQEMRWRFALLETENQRRNDQDRQQSLSVKEERKGRRASYLHFQHACPICQQVPKSMVPSNCENCGQF